VSVLCAVSTVHTQARVSSGSDDDAPALVHAPSVYVDDGSESSGDVRVGIVDRGRAPSGRRR
jgi:hypothetical protein